MQLKRLLQPRFATHPETKEADRIASDLLVFAKEEPMRSLLQSTNRPRAHSKRIQDVLEPAALSLGFTPEARGLFKSTVKGLRPDFYRKVGESGILLEVERGQTTTNNADLRDFWKCHICEHAHYLFLVVPVELRHSDRADVKREFGRVHARLKHFFEPRFLTNVRGLWLFGY